MMSLRTLRVRASLIAAWIISASASAQLQPFCFIQLSDSHFSPELARFGQPVAMRGADAIKWINQNAVGPQKVNDWKHPSAVPSFAMMTGDIFEYGAIDNTWQQFERAFSDLPYPIHIVPGNHDNTWVALYRIMRQRHGGENFAFEHHGVKFINLCSASPQEPVPSIDGKTRAWLSAELQLTDKDQPLVISLHHPIHIGSYSSAEYVTFYDELRDYNVIFFLYGHGHSLRLNDHDGLHGIMGGATYGPNAGYVVYDFAKEVKEDGEGDAQKGEKDKVRVAYHYYRDPTIEEVNDRKPNWHQVIEKYVPKKAPPRLFKITTPKPDELVQGDTLRVSLEALSPGMQTATHTFQLDGKDIDAKRIGEADDLVFEISLGEAPKGWRRVNVRTFYADGQRDLRTVAFHHGSADEPWAWRIALPTALKAQPTIVGNGLVIAGTDGMVRFLDRSDGSEVWSFKTKGEILAAPAVTKDLIIFGSGDGTLTGLTHAGKLAWQVQLGDAVYGWPVVAEGVVYVGDNLGRVHARDITNGKEQWTFARADYAIESAVCIWDDLVVFGAWDGYLYAVKRETGEQVWKVLGPKSSEGRGIRYYGPADCGPIVVADRLCVTDRGYVLASYNKAGEMSDPIDLNIAAIAPTIVGNGLVARGVNNRVVRFDQAGEQVWETQTPAGRFPIPPTISKFGVVVCSNTGLLQLLDYETGKVTSTYQATPGWFVMAPVGVDDAGVAFVASMKGELIAVPLVAELASAN